MHTIIAAGHSRHAPPPPAGLWFPPPRRTPAERATRLPESTGSRTALWPLPPTRRTQGVRLRNKCGPNRARRTLLLRLVRGESLFVVPRTPPDRGGRPLTGSPSRDGPTVRRAAPSRLATCGCVPLAVPRSSSRPGRAPFRCTVRSAPRQRKQAGASRAWLRGMTRPAHAGRSTPRRFLAAQCTFARVCSGALLARQAGCASRGLALAVLAAV